MQIHKISIKDFANNETRKKIKSKIKLEKLEKCFNEATKGFSENLIYYSSFFNKYKNLFEKNQKIIKKSAFALEETMQKINLLINSKPDYAVILLGISRAKIDPIKVVSNEKKINSNGKKIYKFKNFI